MSATQIHTFQRFDVWWVRYFDDGKWYTQMFTSARAAFDFAADLRAGVVA